jgi:hypothetical protein
MAKKCPSCGRENSSEAERCACGQEWTGTVTKEHPTEEANAKVNFRATVTKGVRLATGPLKFKLFQALTIALVIGVLACGIGFLEARNALTRALFAAGFLASFGAAAVAIVWLREKLT